MTLLLALLGFRFSLVAKHGLGARQQLTLPVVIRRRLKSDEALPNKPPTGSRKNKKIKTCQSPTVRLPRIRKKTKLTSSHLKNGWIGNAQ